MTFTEYYFNSDSSWYDYYVIQGEQAYIELYELEEELLKMEELDYYVCQKQRERMLINL